MVDRTLFHSVGDNPPKARLLYGVGAVEGLKLLEDASVHTVCTSPPYYGLRDYGAGDNQLGLEDSPEKYAEALVEVFREIKRVLRKDGTLWLNLGDSYAGSYEGGLKSKDLIGIPWRVAFALQKDGWYLRSDIIWSKPNPMPESVKDRPTKAHEYVFLFAHPDSGGHYYYDADAIREPLKGATFQRNQYRWNSHQRTHDPNEKREGSNRGAPISEDALIRGGNKRTLWDVPPASFKGAHFAVWPPKLVMPMIKAGTSAYGRCAACGEPFKRVSERFVGHSTSCPKTQAAHDARGGAGNPVGTVGKSGSGRVDGYSRTLGWETGCSCVEDNPWPEPCVVLDPFSGSATTGAVALQLGRNYVGIDLNEDYLDIACCRIEGRETTTSKQEVPEVTILDLFGVK